MDLNAPLGMMPPPKPKRRAGLIVGVSLFAAVLIAVGAILALSDPRAGEPTAIATVPPLRQPDGVTRNTDLALAGISSPKAFSPNAEPGRDGTTDRTPTGSLQGSANREDGTPALEHGVKVFRSPSPGLPAAPPSTGPLIIDVSRALDEPQRKSSIGTEHPANPSSTPVAEAPKIAIFVSGMGLDESATRTAIEVMPAAVSLAFLPYGDALAGLVDAARMRGHEVLLQLPMQNRRRAPLGPAQGPHGLTMERTGSAMADDLAWLLARVSGYDGVTNLLGAAVSADTNAMTAVLKAVGDHHLFYLDDGTSKRSVAVSLGATLGVPTLQADVVLDATAEPAVVRANLEALAAIARRKGSAIGMASGLPEHLASIARFASELGGQGISLVPVNALTSGTMALSTR